MINLKLFSKTGGSVLKIWKLILLITITSTFAWAQPINNKSDSKEMNNLPQEAQQQSDAHKKMTKGQEDWKNGMLDKAISTLKEAVKTDPSNKQITIVLNGMQGQKKYMLDVLKKADMLIAKEKFKQAKSVLNKAVRVSDKYSAYIEMVKKLDLAKKKVEEKKRGTTKKLRQGERNIEQQRKDKIESEKLLNLSSAEPILQLDTRGHTGLIKDIIITRSGDIITASHDKTIRVWDSTTGKEKRKILGQIGAGSEGKIYAIALSPDEEFLAVGGYLKTWGNIRIYNYKTGKLLKLLKSHTNVVYDLSFGKDGKYLISGSADRTAKIWSVGSFKLLDTIKFHKKHIHAVGILKKDNRYFALSAGFDNQIALYDMKKRKVIKSDKKAYQLRDLAISKKHIAVAGKGREIQIYDHSLNPVRIIPTEIMPMGLDYSPNGKFLIAGTSKSPYNVNIYSVNENYNDWSSFQKHTNIIVAVAFLDNQTAVSGGGNKKEVYIWDGDSAKEKMKIEGVGERVVSVGVRGDRIAWGNKWTKRNGKSKLQKTLNLKTFSIQDSPAALGEYSRISTTQADYTLSDRAGGDYGYNNAILDLKRDSKVVVSITRDSRNGFGHYCYGFYGAYIISGGANGKLIIYDREGREVAKLIGHTGTVWGIAVEGDRLVSGSADQTIRVWDLSQLREQSVIYPQLNLFISKENEYIAWSESGYFTSSVGGDQYVGYHINQGADKEARYVGSDKYFDTLYRPDIISLILETGSESKAIEFAGKKRKVESVDIANSLPPVISLLSPSNIKTDKKRITVKYSTQSKDPITKTIITLNGKQLTARDIVPEQNEQKHRITVELEAGENIIAIKAKNKFAMSDEILIYANKTGKQAHIYKPTLYLLSIGISDYKNEAYNLGVADKDALAITEMFKKQSGKIYKDVQVKTLTNEKATSADILDGLDWIDKEATSKDIVIIFVAGHGINDDKGNYYFLSYEGNSERLRRTALKWTEIHDTISNLPSKVILLADTCHSGNITGTRRDITSAVKSIMNSGTGSIIMTATTGSGYSYEQKSWGHGAFTKALLEGIDQSKADYDKDQSVTIKEIDLYITNRVKELTKGKQKPTTITPQSIPDFAIGVK